MQARLTLPNYTYEDYCQWQGDWELIQGIPFAMSPSPLPIHQRMAAELTYALQQQLRGLKTCQDCELFYEMDWKISEDTVVCPDILVVCQPLDDTEVLTQAPVVIIEILSKSTRLKDRTTKFELYEINGVRYFLMADPHKGSLEAYELVGGEYQVMQGPPFQLEIHPGCTLALNAKDWALPYRK